LHQSAAHGSRVRDDLTCWWDWFCSTLLRTRNGRGSTSPGKVYSVPQFSTEICWVFTLRKLNAQIPQVVHQPFLGLVVNPGHSQASGSFYVSGNIIYIDRFAGLHFQSPQSL
jgi:hypothetical protein